MNIDIYDCISPLDFRYYGQDAKLQELLGPYLTERARYLSEAKVEAAAAAALAKQGVCSAEAAAEIARAAEEITPDEIAAEDARIQHDTRALVNCLQARVSDAAKPFVHLSLTSFDVKDTATAYRYKHCCHAAIVPEMLKLERVLIDLARREKDTLQMGRTHGQHAVPITFGFAMAEYVSRFGNRIEAVKTAGENLRGKISGAVGAYNASSLFFEDPLQFERQVLAELDLQPSTHSTQIVEAEYVVDFFHAIISAFGVLANLADDMRHLQRTEIGEVGEAFDAQQVGSSTMPHKRNPWNFENVKSMWKLSVSRMQTVYADQICEHQRDLTNSASQRFLPEIIVLFVSAVRRMARIMGKLVTDKERMARNFGLTSGMVAAEPAYILLAGYGHPDAHEALRVLTLEAQRTGRPLGELLNEAEELSPYLAKFAPEQRALLQDPSLYTGIASRKAELVCEEWEEKLGA
jgi:adenylosuccinate lyase